MATARFSEHASYYTKTLIDHLAYHSREMAVTAVHNNLVRNVDQNVEVSVFVLLDLSVAFDSVYHKILLDVLEQHLV